MFRKSFICLVVLFLIVLPVFAEKNKNVYTSEGWYQGSIIYCGRYLGQDSYDYAINFEKRHPVKKLSNGQLEAVNELLNMYRHSAGDTFFVVIMLMKENGFYGWPTGVFCEFTSDSRYYWWAYN